MKKPIGAMLLLIIVISGIFALASGAQDVKPDGTLYQDVIMTALAPTIQKAVNDYYQKILKESPGFDPSLAKITKIERPNAYRTTYFIIEIEAMPYFGPHIETGRDRVTISLKYGQEPEVLKFEHLEDYPLPEHYRYLYVH